MAYKHVHTQTLDIRMNSIRWNIVVSPNTDQSVRMYLAGQGGGRKGDLSRFIEEAVRAHILELSAEQAKAANVNVSEADLTAIVAEAVQWAREH
jgi:post-segregation antitoxin (ccd killing protein)